MEPLRRLRPTTLAELVEIVGEAESGHVAVRAVGSGHSWSDVALTPGFLVETHGLARELPVDCTRAEVDTRHLVRTEAGIRLRELNARLERQGLALSNLGGWDAQTLAGVISTSTHGSGLGLGPLADAVRSLDLVAARGRVYRIERDDGPTDPDAFARRHPDWQLVQRSDWFDAAVVAMGCMGLIYAVTLAVEPLYLLTEERYGRPWSKLAEDLRAGAILRDNRHLEIYVNPHRRHGDNLCVVTRRNYAKDGAGQGVPARRRNLFPEIAGALPFTPALIDLLVGLLPELSPALLDGALKALADKEYTDVSYRVLNLGTANLMPAYSMEIGLPVDEREHHIAAVDAVIAISERHRAIGRVYSTSPVALRFVKRSSAFLSMMHDRDTMMIELIQLTRTEGGFELLAAYEEALYALGGRPHWGQFNTLTGSHGLVESMYPRYPDWQHVHRQLNDTGVFDGPFSKRVGISASRYRA